MQSRIFKLAATAALASACVPALAHISYTGRNLGSYTGLTDGSNLISNQTVSGNFGWADATDADFGDSHKSRAFRFHLDNEAWVTISAQANPTATGASIGGLLPGFSIYSGLVHIAPAAADHDGANVSLDYLATLPGVAKEGAWNALGDWKIGNDSGVSFADLSSLTFKGYAVDGTSANFGSAAGVMGDGLADGKVKGTFKLAAGDYSVFVAGADYAAQDLSNPLLAKAYGVSVGINVAAVPEPETYALLLAGLGIVAMVRRRQQAR